MRALVPPGPASAVTEKPHLSRDMLSEERVRAATRACAYSHSETETHAAGEDLKALLKLLAMFLHRLHRKRWSLCPW